MNSRDATGGSNKQGNGQNANYSMKNNVPSSLDKQKDFTYMPASGTHAFYSTTNHFTNFGGQNNKNYASSSND